MAYNSLSTSNLPDPGVDPNSAQEPRDYFETFLYTGNGTGLQVGDVIKKPADTTTISQSVIIEDGSYLDSGSISAATDAERRTWAWSGWVKFYDADSESAYLLNQVDRDGSGSEISYTLLEINSTGTVRLHDRQQSSNLQTWETSGKVNKDGMWHHILFHKDSTNQSNIKIWIDGVQQTLTLSGTFVTNFTSPLGSSTASGGAYNTMRYGRYRFAGTEYDRAGYYLAEVHFVQGSLPALSTFGEFDANGIWIPKAVTGLTYGTHGHKFTFADSSSFGDDTSGNTFDFTGTGFATTDQVTDSPTNNCALHLNPSTATTHTISEGNLKTTNTSGTHGGAVCNRAYFSGKWYHEVKILAETSDKGQGVGIGNRVTRTTTDWGNYTNIVAYMSDGTVHKAGGYFAFGTAHNTNDIIGVAYDHDARTLEFFHNGTSQGTLTESDFHSTIDWDNIAPLVFGRNVTQELNFGQRTLVHTPPTGYVTMTENNITVDDQNLESPDFVWIKNRDQADQHHLYDSVRGIQKAIYSSANTIETAEPDGLVDFNKNGFTIGSEVEVNTANEDYVAWCWKTGTSFSYSGETGTIDSVGSVNTDSGFSIVTYTGSSVANEERVKHGLSSAPEMIMVKNLSGADSWAVYHKDLSINNFLELNFNYAQASGSNPRFLSGDYGTSTPTSTYFYVRNYAGSTTNDNGDNYVAYCFHSVDGFSKFDRYVGNGSADGTFVYTGFRPAFVMVKRYNTTGNWLMYDSKVDEYNVMYQRLYANLNLADGASGADIDFVSNGFKHRRLEADQNASNSTYIYMAFAETPFKYATAR